MSASQFRILVVDDEEDILEFVSYNLRKEGYTVETAANGRLGLEVADRFKPHMIILDIMMPELDGVETCRELRANPKYNDTVIVFLTARSEDYSQIAGLDMGGDDYVTKPIRPRVLLSRIAALLRRHPDSADRSATKMKLGELTIDREKFIIKIGERSIDMAKKEFELLNLLASKPGKVFTRDEIFAKIWGADIIVGNRTIDVYIRKLREKIGDHYIKTIKGVGYKFEF